MIAAVRLRRGKAADARGAGPFTGEALATARQAGATGTVVVRADSQFYDADVVPAYRGANARFSLTVRMNPHVAAAISAIGEDAWTPIRYPDAFVDPGTGELVSDADVAEVEYTAVTSHRKAEQVAARLASGPPPERRGGGRAGQAVHGLALPPRLHRQPVRDAPGRALAPAARHDRAGHRGRQELRTRTPALRRLPGQRGLAHHLGDRPQSAASRRSTHRNLPGEGHQRDTARTPGPRPGPNRLHRTEVDSPPTGAMALAARLRRPLPGRPCAAG